MKHILVTTLSLAAAVGLCLAQGPRGQQGPRGGGQPGAGLDMTKLQTVAGAVTAVNIGYGMEHPSITVNKVQIKVAPIWYLLDQGFELKAGDPLSVTAAPSTVASDPYLYAVEIANTATRLRLVLRDAAGAPLWAGRGNSGGPGGTRAQGGCLDPATAVTVAGAAVQVNAGVGIQMPALQLKTADGKLLTIKIGPERTLLAADFEIRAGDALTVTYVVESCTDELVALSLKNAAGVTLVLRDADCSPAW